jgi:cell division protein FtsQ
MDRSRRQGAWGGGGRGQAKDSAPPPASSRLTLKPRRNRRRPESLWSRLPKPGEIADSCGRALRRSLPALVGAGVLAAVGGSAWAGYRWVTTSPRFAIEQISVQGNHHLTADEIRAALPVHVGDNLFATSLGRVERSLRDNPWVADVELHRVLPHTISIEVREHQAAAVAELGGMYLVDAAGHAFKRAAEGSDEGAGLPVITGLDRDAYLADGEAIATQIRAALGALARWNAGAARPAISELRLDTRGALALVVADRDTAIELGPIDGTIGARMRTFDTAWGELADSEREHARAIHLDSGSDHVTVAFKDQ